MMKEYADYGISRARGMGKFHKGFACYENHPVLMLGGGALAGGSCISPIHDDADVYVGLDHRMTVRGYYPWEVGREITQFLYPIPDMCAPADAKSFTRLVEYLCNQLHLGKKVHVGCVGGHGRTGTVFAAIFAVLNNDKDAIETVRNLYCKKAVETSIQVEFLNKHFGINQVPGSKEVFRSRSHIKVGGFTNTDFKLPSVGYAKAKSTVFSTATKIWPAVSTPRRLIGVLF